MASLTEVRAALAARLAVIDGLRVPDLVPPEISPPAAVIVPGVDRLHPAIVYDKAMCGGAHTMHFLVKILVSTAHDVSAQRLLDGYLASAGDTSVKAAIEDDMTELTVGDEVVADYAQATEVLHYGLTDWAGVTYLGADMHVEVLTR